MSTKVKDWVHFYKIAVRDYGVSALISCLENEGEVVLSQVLNELGLGSSLELIKDCQKKSLPQLIARFGNERKGNDAN